MEKFFKPTGTTPFEIAEARAVTGQAEVKAATALEELITTMKECDILISDYQKAVQNREVTDEIRDLAIQALRDKEACNVAIDKLSEVILAQFEYEA